MKIITILLAILFALFGIRLLLSGLKAVIMFLKADNIPQKAKQIIFRDLTMGILLLILAIAMLT
jgi:hypothetical protein